MVVGVQGEQPFNAKYKFDVPVFTNLGELRREKNNMMLRYKANDPEGLLTKYNEIDEYLKCAYNPYYFICNRYYISSHGKKLFKLYPYQIQMLHSYLTNDFVISLKGRQLGLSELYCAFMTWLGNFHPNKTILTLSIKKIIAQNLLEKIKFGYSNMLPFLRKPIINGVSGSIGTKEKIVFIDGNKILASPASPDAARSLTLTELFLDEVAFIQDAESIWSSAKPTLSLGGKCYMGSTPFGTGNLFHKIYTEAIRGENDFVPLLLNWSLHPDRDAAWFARELRNMGEARALQELCCSFLGTGRTVFSKYRLKAYETEIQHKLNTGRYYEILDRNDKGQITGAIMRLPKENERIIISADVATGRSQDKSTLSAQNLEGEEIAWWNGRMTPANFSLLLIDLAIRLNYALIAWEINGVGNEVTVHLQNSNYPNLYYTIAETKDVNGEVVRAKIHGWNTNVKTRKLIIARGEHDIEKDNVIICNPFMISESNTFIYDKNNKPVASGKSTKYNPQLVDMEASKYHDDNIMSWLIGNYIRQSAGILDMFLSNLGEL